MKMMMIDSNGWRPWHLSAPALTGESMPKSNQYYQQKFKDQDRAITEAYIFGGYTLKQIGDFYGKNYTTISRIVKKNEMR